MYKKVNVVKFKFKIMLFYWIYFIIHFKI